MIRCVERKRKDKERKAAKRMRSEIELEDGDDGQMDHPQKTPRLSQVGVKYTSWLGSDEIKRTEQNELLPEIQDGEASENPAPSPSPEPAPPPGRPTRIRKFPTIWKDYETTSYSPVTSIPPVNNELFEERIEPPVVVQPEALTTPNMSASSSHRSALNRFRICRVYSSSGQDNTSQNRLIPNIAQSPLPHPFKNDSYFEAIKAFCLGPSSKSIEGMDTIMRLISSGKVVPEEVQGFRAATELRRLDKFGAESPIAGGPWRTSSVRIKMPCAKANGPSFSKEGDAPEFEISGIRYRSLVDLLTSKLQDPASSTSFVHTPFSEWWCPPGSTTPIRIYGEAYSSDIAIQLYEEIKGIPPPADSPPVESAIVLLILGSDATHLANFGTASLWPIYVFFGNMSKYDSSKPTEFAACHLAYLPKVQHIHYAAV